MKNESKMLPRFLNCVKNNVDEIICVDTGSTDNSIKIATDNNIKVKSMPWNDDFAEPRNETLRLATKGWILILDPDEIVDAEDWSKIKALTNSTQFDAYRLTTRNYHNGADDTGKRPVTKLDQYSKGFKYFTPSTKTRLFRNNLNITFRGCYHELVDYSIEGLNLPIQQTNIPIHHWNHEICQLNYDEKKALYCRLAEKKITQEPNNLHAWYEAGVTFAIAGLRKKALFCMIKSMERGQTDHNRLLVIARLYDFLKMPEMRRLAFSKAVCRLFPELTHIDASKRPLGMLTFKK